MNKILYGVLSWWEIIQTCPISRQELLMKFSLNLFFIWFFVVFTKPPILVNEILKNDSHPVHLFLQRSFSWCLVGFVFREKKNNIWRLNASDAKSYEWNSEKLYFLISYLVQKKNIWEWAVFFHIITIALGSYWQTVTEMRASLRKKENYCFGGNWHLSMDEDEGGGNQLTQDA